MAQLSEEDRRLLGLVIELVPLLVNGLFKLLAATSASTFSPDLSTLPLSELRLLRGTGGAGL